jgi:citrate lyase subunit gamma (acyl carrier protein)
LCKSREGEKMKILKPAKAGTYESNDIYIMIQPNDNGIKIELESIVMKQFGKRIEEVIKETLEKLEVKDAYVVAKDRGALDYTVSARVETAVKRAGVEK